MLNVTMTLWAKVAVRRRFSRRRAHHVRDRVPGHQRTCARDWRERLRVRDGRALARHRLRPRQPAVSAGRARVGPAHGGAVRRHLQRPPCIAHGAISACDTVLPVGRARRSFSTSASASWDWAWPTRGGEDWTTRYGDKVSQFPFADFMLMLAAWAILAQLFAPVPARRGWREKPRAVAAGRVRAALACRPPEPALLHRPGDCGIFQHRRNRRHPEPARAGPRAHRVRHWTALKQEVAEWPQAGRRHAAGKRQPVPPTQGCPCHRHPTRPGIRQSRRRLFRQVIRNSAAGLSSREHAAASQRGDDRKR